MFAHKADYPEIHRHKRWLVFDACEKLARDDRSSHFHKSYFISSELAMVLCQENFKYYW